MSNLEKLTILDGGTKVHIYVRTKPGTSTRNWGAMLMVSPDNANPAGKAALMKVGEQEWLATPDELEARLFDGYVIHVGNGARAIYVFFRKIKIAIESSYKIYKPSKTIAAGLLEFWI